MFRTMKLFQSLGACPVAVLLCSAFAGLPASAGERLKGPVPALVTAVIDGDTLEVKARIWLGQEVTTRVRLAGIDAPEARSDCAQEQILAVRAVALLKDRLGDPAVQLYDITYGKYAGRILARVETADGEDLGRALLAAGLARPYAGGRRAPWCGATAARE